MRLYDHETGAMRTAAKASAMAQAEARELRIGKARRGIR